MSNCCGTTARISPAPDVRISRGFLQETYVNNYGGYKKCETTNNKKQLLRMIGVTIIPIFILIGLNIAFVQEATSSSQSMKRVRNRVEYSIRVFGELIHFLQIERGTTALYLSSNSSDIYRNLEDRYIITDNAIGGIDSWIQSDDLVDHHEFPEYLETKEHLSNYIQNFRDHVEPGTTTLYEDLVFYTDIIEELNWMTSSDFKVNTNENIWPNLVGYQQLILAKDHAGVERALGSSFFATGGFDNLTMYKWFVRESNMKDTLLGTSQIYSSVIEKELSTLTENINLEASLEILKDEIFINDYANLEPSWQRGNEWFFNMTMYINLLLQVQENLALVILTDLDEAISTLRREYIISVTIMTSIFLLSPLILQSIVSQTRKIQKMSDALQIKMIEADSERTRAEMLLHQMLPPSVAQILKTKQTVEAEYFDEVTIFFSDLVNFTMICSQSTPMQVVDMLNTLYQSLDGLIEQFDAYKVETIGDAYMVASGVPTKNGKQHAVEIGKMSIAIRHSIHHLTIPHMPGNHRYIIRIGIHTGPCAAGVVGRIMPRYCLFGDTVNTASRMESTGAADRIHMSEATYLALKGYQDYQQTFSVRLRGSTLVKGKGDMTTYWLEARYPSLDAESVRRALSLQDFEDHELIEL